MSWRLRQCLFIALLACVSPVFAGSTIRVSIEASGDSAGLVVQAYRAVLRSTPGVIVVPEGTRETLNLFGIC